MTKKIALPLILAASLGLAACHKAETSTENSVDINDTTNEATADVNAADASAMTPGNDMAGSTGAMTDNSTSGAMSGGSMSTTTTNTSTTSMKNTDMDSAAGNATTDAMHNKE